MILRKETLFPLINFSFILCLGCGNGKSVLGNKDAFGVVINNPNKEEELKKNIDLSLLAVNSSSNDNIQEQNLTGKVPKKDSNIVSEGCGNDDVFKNVKGTLDDNVGSFFRDYPRWLLSKTIPELVENTRDSDQKSKNKKTEEVDLERVKIQLLNGHIEDLYETVWTILRKNIRPYSIDKVKVEIEREKQNLETSIHSKIKFWEKFRRKRKLEKIEKDRYDTVAKFEDYYWKNPDLDKTFIINDKILKYSYGNNPSQAEIEKLFNKIPNDIEKFVNEVVDKAKEKCKEEGTYCRLISYIAGPVLTVISILRFILAHEVLIQECKNKIMECCFWLNKKTLELFCELSGLKNIEKIVDISNIGKLLFSLYKADTQSDNTDPFICKANTQFNKMDFCLLKTKYPEWDNKYVLDPQDVNTFKKKREEEKQEIYPKELYHLISIPVGNFNTLVTVVFLDGKLIADINYSAVFFRLENGDTFEKKSYFPISLLFNKDSILSQHFPNEIEPLKKLVKHIIDAIYGKLDTEEGNLYDRESIEDRLATCKNLTISDLINYYNLLLGSDVNMFEKKRETINRLFFKKGSQLNKGKFRQFFQHRCEGSNNVFFEDDEPIQPLVAATA